MVIAMTQIGKTGAMIQLIYHMMRVSSLVPENVFIITGLSSTDWLSQTRARFPQSWKTISYAQPTAYPPKKLKYENSSETRKNVLIIMDEVQCAARQNQSIHKIFMKLTCMTSIIYLKMTSK